ncbi:MAG TPA: hypothetical protein PLD73_15780 [Candidatus Hydrogenedentes bacterium]|nr:hypothetical protein [Candidatus Hydrogenedentota bacterium]HPJ99247.1 hypothetical protein [Candidatus Hydrogenedentota bacterium]
MDILRKLGDWGWMNKERLVLAILVIFLIYRIYVVMNPTTIEEQTAQAAAAQRSTAAQAAMPGPPAIPGMPSPSAWDDDDEDEDEDYPGGRPGVVQSSQRPQAQRAASGDQPLVFTQHMPPKRIPDPTNLPAEWTEAQGKPPVPPANPLPPSPVAYNALVKENPFTAATVERSTPDGPGGRPNLRLLAIREWGDTYRAQIQTRTRKWYAAGESFETYQLVSIDPDAGTVVIFSEQDGQNYTFALNR